MRCGAASRAHRGRGRVRSVRARSAGARAAPARRRRGVAHRQRQRRPPRDAGRARRPAARRRRARASVRASPSVTATVAAEVHDPVGVLHDALEPVLGDDDRRPEVVHEPRDRGEHLLGRGGVERGCRFVEHEHARVRGQHRTDRDALLLAARQRAQRAVAQLGQSEQVERLLDALAHHVGRERRAAPSRTRALPRRCR